MTSVEELLRLVPRPTGTRPAGRSVWGEVEFRLEVSLPADYKSVVDAYGSGAFGGFIWLLQPCSANQALDLARQVASRLDALRVVRGGGEPVPFDLGDAFGGELLPWGFTENGDVCYWVRKRGEPPEMWSVAVNEARGPAWELYDGSVADFLVSVLSGVYRVSIFPADFPEGASFSPQCANRL